MPACSAGRVVDGLAVARLRAEEGSALCVVFAGVACVVRFGAGFAAFLCAVALVGFAGFGAAFAVVFARLAAAFGRFGACLADFSAGFAAVFAAGFAATFTGLAVATRFVADLTGLGAGLAGFAGR